MGHLFIINRLQRSKIHIRLLTYNLRPSHILNLYLFLEIYYQDRMVKQFTYSNSFFKRGGPRTVVHINVFIPMKTPL